MVAHHWRDRVEPRFQRSYRPSLAYRMALVGEARFDGMLTLRHTWEWDVAAGSLIISEAGGRVTGPGIARVAGLIQDRISERAIL